MTLGHGYLAHVNSNSIHSPFIKVPHLFPLILLSYHICQTFDLMSPHLRSASPSTQQWHQSGLIYVYRDQKYLVQKPVTLKEGLQMAVDVTGLQVSPRSIKLSVRDKSF